MNEYAVIYSGRKTLALQLMRDGSLLVRAPYFTSKKQIESFVEHQSAWIEKTKEKIARRPVYSDDKQTVAALKEKARRILPQKTARYAQIMGLFPASVKIGCAKTRFGSCTSDKNINYSCYLMLYPEKAIDYVVVHELAHLRYMDHGKAFYDLIASILPDYKERRALLKGGYAETEPASDALVSLAEYLPEAEVDLRYAGTNNFTGKKIYESGEAYLRFGTVKRLKEAAKLLAPLGLKLKIWDAYRPVSAQFRLWEICPDPCFVADPTTGFSDHSRGNTVDVTLCRENGTELEMPSGFDDFSSRANRDYSACTPAEAANARLLEKTLCACGFTGYDAEWWHYSDVDSYDVVKERRTP